MSLLHLIILLLIALWGASGRALGQEKLPINQGIIDLREHTLHPQSLFSAQGHIAFYWRKTLTEAIPSPPDAFLSLPGSWNSHYPTGGFGVYHLTILTRSDLPALAVKIPRLNFAHRVWSAGQLLSEVGQLHPDPERNQPGFSPPQILFLPVIAGRADLWLEASEYWQHYPGINGRLMIGHPKAVLDHENRETYFALIPRGGLLLISLYMIGVGWFYRRDRSLMAFGGAAMVLFIYLMAADEARGVSMLGISSHKIYYAIYNMWMLVPYFMLVYSDGQFPEQSMPGLRRLWGFVGVSAYLLQFTMTLKWFFYLINVYQFLVMLYVFYFTSLAYRVWRARTPGGKSLFLAVLTTAVCIVNDLLYHAELIRSFNMVGFGCVLFFLWLAISITHRALSNLNRAEKAEGEARSLAQHLEERVQEQTASIRDMMTSLQKDKEKIEELNRFISEQVLRRYLPSELLEDIQNKRLQFDDQPRTMTVTVLFADLCEFTRATERLGAERITILLNQFFSEMTRIVFNTGGTIDKFTGDGIMVLFGAPKTAESVELNAKAISCALKMQDMMRELNQRWQREFGQGLLLRIGLHHGLAVVGSFGNEQRVDYTAIGGTVNLASRLEGIAQPGQITCTMSVLKDLPLNRSQSIGYRTLKGFKEPIEVFEILLEASSSAA